jgi:phenylpyruvate tautomerase PptA (4-oxalocrotonate tautomerase family)
MFFKLTSLSSMTTALATLRAANKVRTFIVSSDVNQEHWAVEGKLMKIALLWRNEIWK